MGGYILFVLGMEGLASEEFGGGFGAVGHCHHSDVEGALWEGECGLGAAYIGINAQLFAHQCVHLHSLDSLWSGQGGYACYHLNGKCTILLHFGDRGWHRHDWLWVGD